MKIISLLVNILGAILLVHSVFALLMAAMMFNDGSDGDNSRQVIFYVCLGLPPAHIAAQGLAWVAWARSNYARSIKCALAPLLCTAVAVAMLALSSR